ncbi:MAG: tRNA pseudouridine(55) synthase TruB [Cardiobacteriaceae bacterium]|nr:tRNA pseudouridine(55) synthase TruB [Cardiobacteriaceae bacterium]
MKRTRKPLHAVLLLDKPVGVSSNHALQQARWIYQAAKAGHGGTLDPFASGLLPVLFGDATKFGRYFLDGDKAYEVRLAFGAETDTGDLTGQVMREAVVPNLQAMDWQTVCTQFTGAQMQTPPAFSALKIDGQRAYELARRGEMPEMAAREVVIHELRVLQVHEQAVDLYVRCSKGTYIRSLVRDIAAYLGSAGHASALRRVEVAGLQDMVALGSLRALREAEDFAALQDFLLPLEACVAHLPRVEVPPEKFRFIRNGNDIACVCAHPGEVALYHEDAFFGVGESRDGRVYPLRLCSM